MVAIGIRKKQPKNESKKLKKNLKQHDNIRTFGVLIISFLTTLNKKHNMNIEEIPSGADNKIDNSNEESVKNEEQKDAAAELKRQVEEDRATITSILTDVVSEAIKREETRLRKLEEARKRREELLAFAKTIFDDVLVCVETEIDRLWVWPFALQTASSTLLRESEQFMHNANPIKIHIDEMCVEVEKMIERERRQICLNSIDCIITLVRKRQGFEPLFVKRRARNMRNKHRDVSSSTIEDMICKLEKLEGQERRRTDVRNGVYNPDPTVLEIAPRVHEHLLNMIWWVEQTVKIESDQSVLPNRRAGGLKSLLESHETSKLEKERSLRQEHKETLKHKSKEAVSKVQSARSKERANQAEGEFDTASFDQKTKELEKEAQNEIEKETIGAQDAEFKNFRRKLKEEQQNEVSKVEAEYEEKSTALAKLLDNHQHGRPGNSKEPNMLFNRTNLYSTMFHNIMYDEALNLVCDNISCYFDPESYAALKCVNKTLNDFSSFCTDRNYQSTYIQSLRRRQLAKRKLNWLRLRLNSCLCVQRIMRGCSGRIKATAYKRDKRMETILETRFGSNASIVRIITDDNPTIESNIAAAEALELMSKCKGGLSLVQDAKIAEQFFEKYSEEFIDNGGKKNKNSRDAESIAKELRLSALAKTAKSGKNEWASIISFVGSMEVNDATKSLVMEKNGAKSILNMMQRGSGLVKIEGARTIMKLCENLTLCEYFVGIERFPRILVRMLSECNEYVQVRRGGGGKGKGKGGADFNLVYTQQLQAIETVLALLKTMPNDGRITNLLGKCGILKQLLRAVNNVTYHQELIDNDNGNEIKYSEGEETPSTKRFSLLELCSTSIWKLIVDQENAQRLLSDGAALGSCLRGMLESRIILANRLGCILIASVVETNKGKALMNEFLIPSFLDHHTLSNNPAVREAAIVAIEALAQLAPKGNEGEEFDYGATNTLGAGIDMNILLVREPRGLNLGHFGNSIKNTNQYLKKLNIVEPPSKAFRLHAIHHNSEYLKKMEEKDGAVDRMRRR